MLGVTGQGDTLAIDFAHTKADLSPQTIIKPTGAGLLSGMTIAIKDNVSVAGLPLTGGTQPFHLSKDKPYPISNIDAPVVSRVLEAGATIIGTSTCENYCMSALSFTSATGPVDSPWLKGYTCGGSSSGSAALVGIKSARDRAKRRSGATNGACNGEDALLGEGADLALGADQGGSIRMPAAYTGIYGLKPTHGLVPYTGLLPLHPAIDHCGPMAGSVRDAALLLAVLAGYDGLDPRMSPETPLRAAVAPYHELLDAAVEARRCAGLWTPTTAARGLRVGLVKEAWSSSATAAAVGPGPQPLSDEVAAAVRRAGQRFAALGGVVEEVSIPLHAHGSTIFTAATRGALADVVFYGRPPDLLSWPLLAEAADAAPAPAPDAAWFEALRRSAPTVPAALLSSALLDRRRDGRLRPGARARAVVQAHRLRRAYDEALARYDVLVTPANPTVGPRHPRPDLGVLEKYEDAIDNTWNTCPFNLTGHPGLVIPVGWGTTEDGEGRLPIGMQLVGKRWDESKLFFAAAAWEVGGLGLDG